MLLALYFHHHRRPMATISPRRMPEAPRRIPDDEECLCIFEMI
jgi:hypothetical protein